MDAASPHAKALRVGIIALKVIAGAGVLAAAMVAPNVLQAVPLFMGRRTPKRYYPFQVTRALDRLKRKGFIRLVKQQGRGHYEVTQKGSALLARYVLHEQPLPRPRRWDNRWRLLMFDIRETRKPTRENIRAALQSLGFCRLQDSVWVYPYPCEEVLELLRTAHGVRTEVMYVTADRFVGDRWLLEEYNLPLVEE